VTNILSIIGSWKLIRFAFWVKMSFLPVNASWILFRICLKNCESYNFPRSLEGTVAKWYLEHINPYVYFVSAYFKPYFIVEIILENHPSSNNKPTFHECGEYGSNPQGMRYTQIKTNYCILLILNLFNYREYYIEIKIEQEQKRSAQWLKPANTRAFSSVYLLRQSITEMRCSYGNLISPARYKNKVSKLYTGMTISKLILKLIANLILCKTRNYQS
jgi:hypothetical protein